MQQEAEDQLADAEGEVLGIDHFELILTTEAQGGRDGRIIPMRSLSIQWSFVLFNSAAYFALLLVQWLVPESRDQPTQFIAGIGAAVCAIMGAWLPSLKRASATLTSDR